MKKTFYVYLTSLLCVLMLVVSCDDDKAPDSGIKSNFKNMYPDATHVEWEKKGEFHVVDFYSSGMEKEAWFNLHGTWLQTVTDVPNNRLPESIYADIKAGTYAGWRIDDVDYLERKDMVALYIVEVESMDRDVYLYYLENGVYLKSAVTMLNEFDFPKSAGTYSNVVRIVKDVHPTAGVIEIEYHTEYTSVNILYEDLVWKMILDKTTEWVYTSCEVNWKEVPATVRKGLEETKHQYDEANDSIEKVIRPYKKEEITVYKFTLEHGLKVISIREDGSLFEE